MNIKSYPSEDRGVSPVIAVILMVAITVILASVIGTFVLDMSDTLNEGPPQTTWDVEQKNYTVQNNNGVKVTKDNGETIGVTLTYAGGEAVDARNLNVTIEGEPAVGTDAREDLPKKTKANAVRPFGGSGELTAGQSVTILGGTPQSNLGYPFQVINTGGGGLDFWLGGGIGGANDLHEDKELDDVNPGDTIRIRYESAHGTSDILYEYTVTL